MSECLGVAEFVIVMAAFWHTIHDHWRLSSFLWNTAFLIAVSRRIWA